jgi:hypothetical protein
VIGSVQRLLGKFPKGSCKIKLVQVYLLSISCNAWQEGEKDNGFSHKNGFLPD